MIRGKFQAQDDFDLAGHRFRNWKWLNDLPTEGAEPGQVVTYDGVNVEWADATGGGGSTNTLYAGTGISLSANTGDITITCDLTWSELGDKPSSFTPSTHTHTVADITDYNAITAINAGTNIEVDGSTVAVTSTPQFDSAGIGRTISSTYPLALTGSSTAAIYVDRTSGVGASIRLADLFGFGEMLFVAGAFVLKAGADSAIACYTNQSVQCFSHLGVKTSASLTYALDVNGSGSFADEVRCNTLYVNGESLTYDGSTWFTFNDSLDVSGTVEANTHTVNGVDMAKFNASIHFDGGGTNIESGKLAQFRVPADAKLIEVSVLADKTDTCTFSVDTCTYGAYDTFSDKTGGLDLTLSAAIKSSKTSLTTWNTTFAEGEIVRVTVDTTNTTQNYLTVVFDFERGG